MDFFFQAEDGIRDLYVTGVQTCALPILAALVHEAGGKADAVALDVSDRGAVARAGAEIVSRQGRVDQIGRASCRERVEISGVGVSLKRKQAASSRSASSE